MIKEILEKHGVYTQDLELDLLRNFEKLRSEMFASWEAAQQGVQRTLSTPPLTQAVMPLPCNPKGV